MSFIVGDEVTYKQLNGIVSFVSKEYVSVLVNSGAHKSQNVNVVVYASDYDEVHYQDEK